ncbi:ENV9, partial [Symbiodinium pilosum]
ATVVMLNRKSSRAEAAEEQVKKEVSNDGKVMTVECDLQDMDNVKAAAEKIKELFSESGVDVLCNNAGVMALADEATKDGYDVQMQTNHLSHFLLTKEIFPLLEK